jgi:hypothetical protein
VIRSYNSMARDRVDFGIDACNRRRSPLDALKYPRKLPFALNLQSRQRGRSGSSPGRALLASSMNAAMSAFRSYRDDHREPLKVHFGQDPRTGRMTGLGQTAKPAQGPRMSVRGCSSDLQPSELNHRILITKILNFPKILYNQMLDPMPKSGHPPCTPPLPPGRAICQAPRGKAPDS